MTPHAIGTPFLLQELQHRYELALELLGERNERVDALEDDVREMKHIFHSQLSSLVDELNWMRTAQSTSSRAASTDLDGALRV